MLLFVVAPIDPMFREFRKIYPSLVWNGNDLRLWSWPEDPHDFLAILAGEARDWGQRWLAEGSFNGDYRELLELVVHYLGGQVVRPCKNRQPKVGFRMMKPGAFHHARFMAKSLYLLKIAMLVDTLPPNFYRARQLAGVHQMAQFIALFHSRYFLQAMSPAAAPRLDLTLWQHMCRYQVTIYNEK